MYSIAYSLHCTVFSIEKKNTYPRSCMSEGNPWKQPSIILICKTRCFVCKSKSAGKGSAPVSMHDVWWLNYARAKGKRAHSHTSNLGAGRLCFAQRMAYDLAIRRSSVDIHESIPLWRGNTRGTQHWETPLTGRLKILIAPYPRPHETAIDLFRHLEARREAYGTEWLRSLDASKSIHPSIHTFLICFSSPGSRECSGTPQVTSANITFVYSKLSWT